LKILLRTAECHEHGVPWHAVRPPREHPLHTGRGLMREDNVKRPFHSEGNQARDAR